MIDPSGLQQGKMNTQLLTGETQPYLTHGEKKAMRRAERAERAFRVARGYEKPSLWERLKSKWNKGG